MSHKKEHLESALRHAVQTILARGLQDPRISGIITITRIHLTGDLKRADLYISVIPESKVDLTLHGLNSAARHIRREIGPAIPGRFLPELLFKSDRGALNELAVTEALAKVSQEREARGLPAEPAAPPAPTDFPPAQP